MRRNGSKIAQSNIINYFLVVEFVQEKLFVILVHLTQKKPKKPNKNQKTQ